MSATDEEVQLGLAPLAVALGMIVERNRFRSLFSAILPSEPAWAHVALAQLLANPDASSDALLIVADALERGREQATANGNPALARGLASVADLFRQIAPHRAGVPNEPVA